MLVKLVDAGRGSSVVILTCRKLKMKHYITCYLIWYIEHLDLAAIFDKLLREHLIETKVHEHLAVSFSSGLTSEVAREK